MPAVPLISEFLYKLVCEQTQTVYKNPGYARRHDEKNLMVYVAVAVFLFVFKIYSLVEADVVRSFIKKSSRVGVQPGSLIFIYLL